MNSIRSIMSLGMACLLLHPATSGAVSLRAATAKMRLSNCTQDTTSTCYTKKICTRGDTKFEFFTAPGSDTVFEFVALSHHPVKPEIILSGTPHESALEEARETNREQLAVHPKKQFADRKRQHFETKDFTSTTTQRGHLIKTTVTLKEGVPACAQQNGI